MRLYNRLLPHQVRAPRSDEEILTLTGLPDPATLLRLCRLRHLGLLYKCSDTACCGLLNSDHDWLQLIRDDLLWMYRHLENTTALPPPQQDFGRWEYLMQFHPNYWKRLVRHAGAHDTGQRHNMHIVNQFHGEVLAILHEAGKLRGAPPQDKPHVPVEVHACMLCERQFGSKGGCGAHLFKVHGRVNPVRHLFAQTHCGACLKEYHTFTKLKAHLLTSHRCRHTLQGRRQRWTPAPGSGSIVENALNAKHDGLLPPLQAQGPCVEAGPLRTDVDYDLDIIEELYTDFLELETIAAVKRRSETSPNNMRCPGKFSRPVWRSSWRCSAMMMPRCYAFLDLTCRACFIPCDRLPLGRSCANSLSRVSLPGIVRFRNWSISASQSWRFPQRPRLPLFLAFLDENVTYSICLQEGEHLHGGMQIYVLSVDIVIDDQWGISPKVNLADSGSTQFMTSRLSH